MTDDDAKRYIGMAMIKFALQFWKNLNHETKEIALQGNDIFEILAKIVHPLRTEFLGEGYIDRDSHQYAEKYVHALLKLELNNMSYRHIYVSFKIIIIIFMERLVQIPCTYLCSIQRYQTHGGLH